LNGAGWIFVVYFFLVNFFFGSIVMDGSVFDAMKNKNDIEDRLKRLGSSSSF
jgi:regulatory protein YycI of two-component signal transduction system YycFG